MVRKLSLFLATAQFSVLRFIPYKKQKLLEYLEAFSEHIPEDLCSQDILEIWLENFSSSGLLLGSLALFLISFVLMAAADFLLYRTHGMVASVLRICSGLYCFQISKGGASKKAQNFLLMLYLATAVLLCFQWTVTLLFLLLFLGNAAYHARGEKSC